MKEATSLKSIKQRGEKDGGLRVPFPYRGRGAVAPQRNTLGRTPLAAVGVGGAAVAVGVLVAPLAISV